MSKKNNKSRNLQMVMTGRNAKTETYMLSPDMMTFANSLLGEYGTDSSVFYREPRTDYSTMNVKCDDGKMRTIVTWGNDNETPFHYVKDTSKSMIAMQCQQFNILCCYGQGLRFVDRETMLDTKDEKIRKWCMSTALHEQFMKMCIDMKYYYWSVVLFTLSRDGSTIVRVQALDTSFCRLTERVGGKSAEVVYGDWSNSMRTEFHAYPLLDQCDPLGDLSVRMGLEPSPMDGVKHKQVKAGQFAMMVRMPTPAFCYYPEPVYVSQWRDAWSDIYRLIGIGKRQLIKNTSAPRIQIEIDRDYWVYHCEQKGIYDEKERIKEIARHKNELRDYVCGLENSGKAITTAMYTSPDGKQVSMVRFNTITDASKKEGGNWSEDMQEAANAICYVYGVHPNLVGATPGKSQMNNSGSDKRELFTLKQALEKAFHDVMATPFHLTAHFNGWDGITCDIPMIQLTTLDQHTDSKKKSITNTQNDGNS